MLFLGKAHKIFILTEMRGQIRSLEEDGYKINYKKVYITILTLILLFETKEEKAE